MLIRAAVPADRDAVLSFWPYPDRLDRRLDAAARGAEALLAAVVPAGGRPDVVAGVASARWSGGCDDTGRPLLYGVEVRPDHRGRGIGTALIRHVAALAGERGFAGITLEVAVDNSAAIRLYHRLGFVTAGPHRHVWRAGELSGAADVLIMHGRVSDLAGG